jgi:hypothetical protein
MDLSIAYATCLGDAIYFYAYGYIIVRIKLINHNREFTFLDKRFATDEPN